MTTQYTVDCNTKLFFRETGVDANRQFEMMIRLTFTSPITNKAYSYDDAVYYDIPVVFVETLADESVFQQKVDSFPVRKMSANVIAQYLRQELKDGSTVNPIDPAIQQQVIDRINNYVIEDFTVHIDLANATQDGN